MTAFGKVISSLSHKKVITRCHRKYKLMLNRKKRHNFRYQYITFANVSNIGIRTNFINPI